MPFTFGEFKKLIRDDVFPHYDGEAPFEADNLIRRHDNAIIDGMTDLQRWVRCLRVNHVNVYAQCTTIFNCGASVVESPNGQIELVYTVQEDGDCNEINYEVSATFEDFKDYLGGTCPFSLPDQTGLPALPRGFLYPKREDPRLPRATSGRYVIHNHRIYIAPRIQDYEKLVVTWNGMKNRWTDEDLLTLWWLDEDKVSVKPTIRRAIIHFLEAEIQRRDNCDLDKAAAALALFADTRADLCYDCAREITPHLWRSSRLPLRKAAPAVPVEAEDEKIVFAYISDYGWPTNGTAEADVAAMVKGWNPDFIVTGGDNQYGSPGDYPGRVGAFYGDYITNQLASNRFWPALGNHDWIDAGIQEFLDYFTLPGKERYYSIFKKPVEFFIVDSDPHEPDGVSVSGTQAEWLRVHLRLSKADWKVVVFQDAPYTSGVDRPGNLWMRWGTFKDWGADVVLNGDTHAYERYIVKGLQYIVAGTGGAQLITFGGYIDDADLDIRTQARISTHGAVFGEATCTTLKLEFRGRDGITYDSTTFTKDQNGDVTAASVTNEAATPVGIITGGDGGVLTDDGGVIIIP